MTDHDKDWLGGKEWQLYVKIKKVYISPAEVPPPQYNIPSLASLPPGSCQILTPHHSGGGRDSHHFIAASSARVAQPGWQYYLIIMAILSKHHDLPLPPSLPS